MDCIDHAFSYRKNFITSEEVGKLFNSTMKELRKSSKAVTGAVVFAMAGPETEFALVNDYGQKRWNISKDTEVLLRFMDPVGVVGIAGEFKGGKEAKLFRTFKGHEWAQKHAAQIIDQADKTLPMYKVRIKPERVAKGNPTRFRTDDCGWHAGKTAAVPPTRASQGGGGTRRKPVRTFAVRKSWVEKRPKSMEVAA